MAVTTGVDRRAVWEGGDPSPERHHDWARSLDALPGGYPNLLGPEEVERTAAAFGPNADRLRRIKKQYDPERVFHATGSL